MIVKVYNEIENESTFSRYVIPKHVDRLDLTVRKDTYNDYIGELEIEWYVRKKDGGSLEYNDTTIRFGRSKCYVSVDGKKFVISNKSDMFELYRYLTSEDVGKFIKEFKLLEGEIAANKDFSDDCEEDCEGL